MRPVEVPLPVGEQVERGGATIWIAAERPTATNRLLASALAGRGLRAKLAEPRSLGSVVSRGDVILGRLDVRATLDGVEEGLWPLQRQERRGMRVLNRAAPLLACHDKLQTVLRLARWGLPQPATTHVDWGVPLPKLEFPVVVKPRFGSWGRDVMLCESELELRRSLQRLRTRAWFRRQGVLVQALVPPAGYDLRIIVAGGRVVGAIERVSAPGEWRTNIALGGTRRRVSPPPDACRLAVVAAQAVGTDLVGVDLLPLPGGGHTVLELNGAVDFTPEYSLPGGNVFEAVARLIDDAGKEPTLEMAGLRC